MARRRKGRPINGVILLDKPTGISSNDALQKVKRIYFAEKAGAHRCSGSSCDRHAANLSW